MAESKHTPGEWVVDFDEANDGKGYVPGWIIYGLGGGAYVGEARREDDARLIAAAPDLYEACKAIMVIWRAPILPDEWRAALEQVEAAIKKVEGESNDHK